MSATTDGARVYEDSDGTYYAEFADGATSPNFTNKADAVEYQREDDCAHEWALVEFSYASWVECVLCGRRGYACDESAADSPVGAL